MIFNATIRRWIPFALWPAQANLLPVLQRERYLAVLKARQLGLTWLCLAYILWRMVFHPAETVGIWSRTETEAVDLLHVRLKGMYDRLPEWARLSKHRINNESDWMLANGSRAMAFATTGGRSYTFGIGLVDEADFQPDLPNLMTAVEPTVDAGGQLFLLSSSNKDLPISLFKTIFEAALKGEGNYRSIFLPWNARPERTQKWYEGQKAHALATTGSLDVLWGEYPATAEEALASRQQGKRIPALWLFNIYSAQKPLPLAEIARDKLPSLPGLEVYKRVEPGRRYVIGGDSAEGNPNSDPSALTVLDVESGEEVAALAGRLEPTTLADYADQLGRYYNKAGMMFERNNHGHACLAWLAEHSECRRLKGHDDRPGWLSSPLGKKLLYSAMADCARDSQMTLHSFETHSQLASIEASTLRAPEPLHDDRADSCALANVGREAILAIKPPPEIPASSGKRSFR